MRSLNPFDISLEGINLVEASAGTGKTYNIASLYVKTLLEYEKNVSEILVVTYTEAATKELKDRLQKRIRESIAALEQGETEGDEFLYDLSQHVKDKDHAVGLLRQAVRSFDEASVYTIHGFCYQALQDQAFESGTVFDAELIGDDTEIVLEAVDDYWRNWIETASVNPQKRPLIKLLTARGYTPDTLTRELVPFTGKPYLKILPEEDQSIEVDARLDKLAEMFDELKQLWDAEHEEIFSMLNSGRLKYYRTDWLKGWMSQMQEWLQSPVSPIGLFGKFDKFTQPAIDSSLKKSSRKKEESPPQHPFFLLADEYRRVAKPLQQFDVFFKKDLLEYLRKTLERKKDELHILSFDDLLIKLNRALAGPERGERLAGNLRAKFPIALVDEFQDTDPIQYGIFKKIYSPPASEGTALFMIGDPKQSIYSFRGADIFAYLQARRDADRNKIFSLTRNFRSVPELLKGINTIFKNHPNPFLLEDIIFEPVEAGKYVYERLRADEKPVIPVQIRELQAADGTSMLTKGDAGERVASDTAQEIVSLIEQGKRGEIRIDNEPLRAKDIVVLVRTHQQADMISSALQQRNVKSVQYSRGSVFASPEAKELGYILRAIAEPAGETEIKSALATRLMGYNAHDLLQLEENEDLWAGKLGWFAEWRRVWQDHGFAFMFRSWLTEAKISRHIIRFENGERRLTNLKHLGELMQAEEQENKRGPLELIKWLARKRKEEDSQQDHEQLRLESDEALVKVITMHRSKGLEYPVVFCPFLWHGPEFTDYGQPLVFHDREDSSTAYLDLQGKSDPDRTGKRFNSAEEELAESVRLAYVALTRAKQRCYLTWVHAGKSECSPLGYLLLPPEIVSRILKSIVEPEDTYRPVEPEVVEEALQEVVASASGTIERVAIPEPEGIIRMSDSDESPRYRQKIFTRTAELHPDYYITSFSSLTRVSGDAERKPGYEQYFDETHTGPVPEAVSEERNIFTFPKGPQPGTCIHKIFEDVEFGNLNDAPEIIERNLELFGIDITWKEVVYGMLERMVSVPLLTAGAPLTLAELHPRDIISELEFYYKVEAVDARELLSLIRGKRTDPETDAESRKGGFMKGFIDLTFCYGGKYYILDYKTNYLGAASEDYNPDTLHDEIFRASYDLQYHIYTIALHRYLAGRLRTYSYEEHFGGVFYLFVRGINGTGREGIFYDRPGKDRILALDQYLKERKRL